jgi:hypothetical protein
VPAVHTTQHEPSFLSLCIACSLQPLATHVSGHAFHINQSLCTAIFAPPVEVVGNRGCSTPIPTLFSNSPQFHNRDLENSPACQPYLFQPFQQHFHFSCLNDGYYCLFLYLLYVSYHQLRFTRPPANPAIVPLPILQKSQPVSRSQPIPGIQRSTPLFHPHNYAKVNTIKRKKENRFLQAATCCTVWPARNLLQSASSMAARQG